MEDETLLKWYMKGFRDELKGSSSIIDDDNPLYLKAYKLGAGHAIVGDDVRSVDYLSNEEILKIINGK